MAPKLPGKSPNTHSDAQIDEAQGNLESALAAVDQGGDQALPEHLKAVEEPEFVREPIPGLTDSYILVNNPNKGRGRVTPKPKK